MREKEKKTLRENLFENGFKGKAKKSKLKEYTQKKERKKVVGTKQKKQTYDTKRK